MSPILSRHVTVKFIEAPLDRVVNAIARQAGFDVVFAPGANAEKARVSLERTDTPAAAALLGALGGSGLSALIERGGAVIRIGVITGKEVGARQTGTVTGRITDVRTGAPLGNADVALDKTIWRTTTDSSGRFRLRDIEPGSYQLTVRRLGYAKQSRPATVVADREDTVNVALEAVAARLDELVTTATGRRRRLDVPNDITTINADSVMQAAPVHSVTDLLENRVPGLTVQRTSGAPGDPARLRLRGAGSPLQNNDPIVVVDGVRVYAKQSDDRSANLAGSLGSHGVVAKGDFATPSPLDYIDPNSIETIEVVKGPSASTLYGPDAANGVIVITTKKGRAGPTRWTMNAAYGRTQLAERYPDLLFRWGHGLYDHVNEFCPLNSPSTPCAGDSVVTSQMLNDPALTMLGRGHGTDLSLTASGGTQALTYSVTGSYRDELGLIKLPDYEAERYLSIEGRSAPDWMRRPQWLKQWGATSSITARLGATADVSLTSTLTRTRQQRSTLEQQLGELMSTFLDRSNGLYYSGTYGFTDALGLGGGTASSYNLAFYRTRVTDAATQFTNSVNASWRARPWLTATANVGLNIDQRADEMFLPRSRDALFLERNAFTSNGGSTGTLSLGTGTSLLSTINAGAVAIAPLGHGLSFRFASGVNYTGTSISDIGTSNTCLPYGTSDISLRRDDCSGGQSLTANRNTADDATFGWYLAPSFTHPSYSIDLGLRLDGGSNYGNKVSGFKLPAFPKLGFSYLLSDAPFFPFKSVFQSVRIRTTYGRAGRQPGPADRLRLYNAATVDSLLGETVTLKTLGNIDLKPERTAELEGGIDADLLDSRLNVIVTGYRKTTQDALIPTPVPASVYGPDIVMMRNIGVIRNTGVNLEVNAQVLRSSTMTWSTRFALTQNRSKVVRLGPGVLPFYTDANVAEGNAQFQGGTRVAAGYPLFGRWSKPILGYADVNGDNVLEPSEILLGDTAVYVGSTEPTSQFTVQPSVALWHGALTVTAGLTHVGGLSQKNEVARRLAPFTRGTNDSTALLAEQLATGIVGKDVEFNWIQTVATTRFDDLSVRYAVPAALARRLGAQSLSIAVQGSNLGLWTNYRGLDPNVNAFATGNSVTDIGVLPAPRTWRVQINASY